MDNLKDKVTNWCGLVTAISATVETFAITLNLPIAVHASCALAAGIAIAVSQFFQGKNADGSKKSVDQIKSQLERK